jgi:RNA polymerase sigma-70 factor (ECF subfamily)
MSLPLPDGGVAASESALVAGIVAGDRDALAGLYHRYAAELALLAARLLRSRSDGEDVMHDLFVGLPEALAGYHDNGRLRGWLRRATVNLALRRMRTVRRRREADLAVGEAEQQAAPGGDDAQLVRRAVEALPDSLRTVVVLKIVEGYSHQEIGELLGISRGASEVRLSRALERLRRNLGET